jgi:hypothetical protein
MPFDGIGFVPQQSPAPRQRAGRDWHSVLNRLRAACEAFARRPPTVEDPDATVTRVLVEAKDLIAEGEDWTQGAYHRAGRYCAVGALDVAGFCLGAPAAKERALQLLQAVTEEQGFCTIEAMNDRISHERVLAAFDVAIARARRAAYWG